MSGDADEISPALRYALGAIGHLSDSDVLDLHREVSRLATIIRQRDPEYQWRQRLGYELWKSVGEGLPYRDRVA